MIGKTNIHNFGKFGATLSSYTGRDGMTIRYDESAYRAAMAMTDERFDAAYYGWMQDGPKLARAAYAVARANRAVNSWRAA